ncbi:MCP four helix bundle domain-containing protein [Clostridium sp. YIM B02505]|uniref:MCP four helix bundle domain-containing protein n=1 Tax=Clostridium yunnanense TaxID=2800325 RepID=A0ABS1ER28_9CLOT|nr:methyl-accepting chemotaxis protein [Clostridium yunnanense]MBK1811836.1 MCP four helix bundle domain-containing protein [Clostridium yunnanense]
MLKNIKVINSIIMMVILSTIVSFAIAVVGYNNMKSIDKNSSLMYEGALVRIVKAEEIRQTFANVRLNMNRISITNFNNDDVTAVENDYNTLVKMIAEYEKFSLSSIEKNNLAEFKNDLNSYHGKAQEMEKGTKLYGINLEKFNQQGNEMQLFLDNLVRYSSNMANSLNNDNNKLYSQSTIVFFITFFIGFVLMMVVSFAIIVVIKKSMKEIILDLEKVAQGDFSINIDTDLKNEFGSMKKSIGKTISNISSMLESVKKSTNIVNDQAGNLLITSDEMASSAHEISNAVHGVAVAANDQSSDLMSVKNSLDNFAEALSIITSSINDVNSNIQSIGTMSENSNSKLKVLFDSINNVTESFDTVRTKVVQLDNHIGEVNDITNIINSIAEQTDLLALNAAIESARAGEVGRGFSVVAEEIRKLAEQSKVSAKNISGLISNINNEVQIAVKTTDVGKESLSSQTEMIEESIKSFAQIFKSINVILPRVEEIKYSIESINVEKDSIISKTLDISGVSEENAASAEEIAASVQEINMSFKNVAVSAQTLSSLTNSMIEEVNRFKL